MSDDVPQPSNNPFIKFKRHVDSRIGTGLSILTGAASSTDSEATGAANSGPPPPSQLNRIESMDRSRNLPASKDTYEYWQQWAQLSPYSPMNLRHLPKLNPAGVSTRDAGLFDFGDAFQDLLAISAGRDMMDLHAQADRKRLILDKFPCGEPSMLWVGFLSSKRLLPQLPFCHPLEMSHHMATTEAWGGWGDQGSEMLKRIEAQQQITKSLGNQKIAVEQHHGILRERILKELDKDITFNPANMFRQIEEIVKRLDDWHQRADQPLEKPSERMPKELDKDVTSSPANMSLQTEEMSSNDILNDFDFDAYLNDEDEWAPAAKQKAQSRQKTEPDTEEDFFSSILGSLAEMRKSLPSKSFVENEVRDSNKPSERTEAVEHDEDGGKTYTISTEHVDRFGNMHQRTEITKVDANGNQISCETKVIVRPSVLMELQKTNEARETGSPASCFRDEKYQTTTSSNGKSTGWFWR